MSDLSCSVLVVSFDRYRDLWQPFFQLFWKYWPDCPFPVFLSSNELSFPDARVTTLKSGLDDAWGKQARLALSQIDSEYILLLLEDFFLDAPVSNTAFNSYLEFVRQNNATVLRLNPSPPPTIKIKESSEIGALHRLASFRVSVQPAIWKRLDLLALLRDDESIWQFEVRGTYRSQAQPSGYFCTRRRSLGFQHVVERGSWFWSTARRYRRQNIGCDFSARAAMGPLTAFRKRLVVGRDNLRSFLLKLPLHSAADDAFAPVRPPPAAGNLSVALLTNFIPPYQRPVLDLLSMRYRRLRVLLSTAMEKNRPWTVDWQGLDVVVQNTFTLKGNWHHARGFSEPLAVHVPFDTVQQLRKFSPDVVISAEMGVRTLFAILYRQLHPRSRLVIWAEAAEPNDGGRGIARRIARRVFVKNADAFLAVGGYTVEYLRRIGADNSKIFKVAYASDLARFSVNGLQRSPDAAKRLLFSGQLVERKGLIPFLGILADWAAAHPQQPVEFWLVGDGPLRSTIESFPLPPNVKLVLRGVFQYADLPAIYSEAGVFVLPTLADTWAVVVNEALAAGLPVLGSVYAQAVAELVENGYNGWTYRIDNRQEAFAALQRMMDTSLVELEVMRANARDVAKNLSPEKVAGLIDAAVSSALAGH